MIALEMLAALTLLPGIGVYIELRIRAQRRGADIRTTPDPTPYVLAMNATAFPSTGAVFRPDESTQAWAIQ